MKYIFILFFAFLICSKSSTASLIRIMPHWNENMLQNIQISLPQSNELKTAIFKRNAYTYFVFQAKEKLQLNPSGLNNLPIVVLKHPSALILRGVFPENMIPSIYVEKGALHIQMEKESSIKNTPINKTKWTPDGLLLELKDASIIDFKDPNTLEDFIVFLTPYSPILMQERYETPEMTFLPTYQGVVVYSKTSDFHIQKDERGFIIYPQNKKSITFSYKKSSVFEEINWKNYAQLTPKESSQEIQDFKSFLPFVSASGKQKIYLSMIKIYLSQGLAESALEILPLVTEKKIKNSLSFLALVLQRNTRQALKEWKSIQNPSSTLKIWKNTIDDAPLFPIEDFENISLPPKMAVIFWENVAQKANVQNNFILLVMAVDKLEKLPLNSYQEFALIYFKGKIAEKESDLKQAIEIYAKAEKLPLSKYSGKILFSKIKAEIQTQKITADEAILQLEKIRPLIVSTEQEIPFLQTLSELYESKNNILQTLLTERRLLSLTQNDNILKKMQKQFERAFITNQKSFNRIAVYNTFKELMPTGIKAVWIKQQLIDDFIQMDLLKEAYDLAMETIKTSYGIIQKNTAIKAYLLAHLLSDTEKQQEVEKYLPENWKEQPLPENLPEILRWSYKESLS